MPSLRDFAPPLFTVALNLVHSTTEWPAPLTNHVTLTATNTVVNHGPQTLTMTITKTNGVFTGTIVLPGTATSLPFQGAILQRQTNGCGYFRNGGQSGWVLFGPAQ